jgi:hypothetical protein
MKIIFLDENMILAGLRIWLLADKSSGILQLLALSGFCSGISNTIHNRGS